MSDRNAEEWGRIAVGLPGWRWMPGMSFGYKRDRKGLRVSDSHGPHFRLRCDDGVVQGTTLPGGGVVLVFPTGSVNKGSTPWPNPDDPATAGCLLELLGPFVTVTRSRSRGYIVHVAGHDVPVFGRGGSLGRACIAAAEAIGRWPGGAE